jgi:hypothetical protein
LSYDIEFGEGDSLDVDVTLYDENGVINLTDTKVVFCMKNTEEVEYNIICVIKSAVNGVVTIPFTTVESDLAGLFLGTFILIKNNTLKTVPSASDSYISVFVKKAIYEVLPVTLTTPTFSVTAGTYSVTQSVGLSADAGASIYYTTDNSTPTNSSTLYSGAISVSSTATIKAIAYRHGDFPSTVASATYTITRDTVATPSISPVSGYFYPTQQVTITCSTSGSVIHYTTDNTEPTASSPTYSSAITVSATTTVRAIAVKSELLNSTEATARTYTLITEHSVTPVISPATRYFYPSLTVNITCSDPSATIHYTTDGSTPTASSPTYSSSFSITSTTTVRAISTKTNYLPSTEATAQTYTYMSEVSVTPSISPVSGYFYPTQQVTITCSDPTAIIHYTTDNTEPTASSSTYSTPITVSATSTVRAISTRTGYVDSAEATLRTYTLITDTIATPSITPTQSLFGNSVEVSISCSTSGASIRYTTDGSTPSGTSTLYSSPLTVSTSCTIKAKAFKTGMFDSLTGEQAYTKSIAFTHTGQTFQPILTVTGSPTILWTYSDGATSNVAAPTAKDFGTAATRTTYLTVTPWSAVTRINVGYDGGDAGANYNPDTTMLAQQNVTDIQGLDLVKSSLVKFAASHNPLTSLDFTDFASLEDIECYYCTSLATGIVTGCTALKRLCVEHCHLPELDLSTNTLLEDLRSAGQGRTGYTITWGDTGTSLWHMCVVDNAGLLMPNIDFANFPSLKDLWIWNCGVSIPLTNLSRTITSLDGHNNHFSSIDLSNWLRGEISLRTCNLSSSFIDSLLRQLDTLPYVYTSQITLTDNAAPTLDYHKNSLIAKGWTVLTETATYTTVEPAVFSVSRTVFDETFDLTLTSATTDAEIHYTTDGSTPTASSPTYSSPISISVTTTVKTIALKTGMADSEVLEKTYTLVGATDFAIWNQYATIKAESGNHEYASDAISVKAGHMILVFATSAYNTGTLTVTDSQSNTYTPCSTQFECASDPITANWWYTFASETGNLTVTFHNNGDFNALRVLEVSGITNTSPVDVAVYGSGSSSGSITTTVADDIIFAGWHTAGTTLTDIRAGTGYTFLKLDRAFPAAPDRPAEYKQLTGTVSGEHATINNTGGTVYGSWVVALKKATA